MAASAQELPPAQQQPAAEQPPSLALALVPQPQAQAQIKPTRVSLSYEEISKLFSLPIAEAASILGVCTSVLKRICRTHGIVRWPYRKVKSLSVLRLVREISFVPCYCSINVHLLHA
uniref:RWP-RK domain-containing protein n=1 Tax=Aegilops tauschii subsp. strangulata TaxID=200361 RepID=A0A453EL95_AEGTS